VIMSAARCERVANAMVAGMRPVHGVAGGCRTSRLYLHDLRDTQRTAHFD
jgi:hypothetical protein